MRIAAALLLLLCVLPHEAHADWFLSAFVGTAHTNSNTLTLAAPATAATIGPVDYAGESWRSPIYYGYRIGWSPAGRRIGVEAEFTHAKAIGNTRSTVLTAFEQSHGLNFVLGNIVVRHPLAGGRVNLLARGGGGFSVPHVEGTYRGNHTESYQYGGLAWQGGGGVEVRLWRDLQALIDGRVTRTAEAITVGGAAIEGTFVTSHFDVGLGWRF